MSKNSTIKWTDPKVNPWKEIGILFSPPMVRALLDGSKTQTRRVVKDLPPWEITEICPDAGGSGRWMPNGPAPSGVGMAAGHWRHCPYGQPGDRLWVRESFVAFGRWETRYSEKKQRDEWHFVDLTLETGQAYRFDGADPNARRRAGAAPTWHNRPSLFMPREASRILLEFASVRVERLNEISETDCWAEGIEAVDGALDDMAIINVAKRMGRCIEDPAPTYAALWESINGAGSWDANPWVWCVEFRRVQP
jgi:hypothetical protein